MIQRPRHLRERRMLDRPGIQLDDADEAAHA
jgi:hypothetical protein